MRIALLGYGKMGKTIAKLAIEHGHEIGVIIDPLNGDDFNQEKLSDIDVAIEFTRPDAVVHNVLSCISWGIPIVSGTTGWLEHMPQIEIALADNPKAAFFYSSNYSLGVNVFFELNRRLAAMMNNMDNYEIKMEEIHHRQKLDSPSGTGITLAEGIIENVDRKSSWVNDETASPSAISLTSKRINDVPGTHSVKYTAAVDDIEIIHTAHNRLGFALGAIKAAEYSIGKSGMLSMRDMLNF